MPTHRLYFAYGSNMNRDQMDQRCPQAEAIGPAVLTGYRFLINERGYATIQRLAGGVVHGALWRITAECEASLDRYEGVAKGSYGKYVLPVVDEKGITQDALVYIDTRARAGRPQSGYLERVLSGAVSFGLPADYLNELRSWQGEGANGIA